MAFLLPNGLGFLLFTFLPILACLALAFFEWDGVRPMSQARWVGLGNFIRAVGFHHEAGRLAANDPNFWEYLGNTLFLMMVLPVSMAGSLALALALNQKLRGTVALRTVFFLPTICPLVATSLVWRWVLNSDAGLLNSALGHLGISNPPAWLDSTAWAKPGIMIMSLWIAVGGYNCILYLAGLQSIPEELYEAAEMDGANWWRKLRHITWPGLRPTTFFIFTMGLIAGFQGGFTQAYLMTSGGPGGATTTITYYIYNNAFAWSRMGYAAAVAWLLFLLVFGATLLNWRLGGKLEEYV